MFIGSGTGSGRAGRAWPPSSGRGQTLLSNHLTGHLAAPISPQLLCVRVRVCVCVCVCVRIACGKIMMQSLDSRYIHTYV